MAVRQEAQEQGTDLGPLLLIAVGAGVLLWLVPKAFPGVFPSIPSGGPALTGDPDTSPARPFLSLVGSSSPARGPRPDSQLVSLLSGSADARKAFLFQAGMYSFHQVEELPDGKNGPLTKAMIDLAALALGTENQFERVNDTVLLNLANALRQLTGHRDLWLARVRLVPGSLPQSLIDRINHEGLRVSVDVPLLQIMAS